MTARLRPFLWHKKFAEKMMEDQKVPLSDSSDITVAIIDTGLDIGHPNLAGAMVQPQIDFGPRLGGVVYGSYTSIPPNVPTLQTLAPLLQSLGTHPARSSLEAVLQSGVKAIEPDDPSLFFGAHGTGCAGLIAGRPAANALPYEGLNPACKLISYATPFSHEYLPVIMALCHAYASDADIVYMPRALPNIRERSRYADLAPEFGTRIDLSSASYSLKLSYQEEGDQADFDRLSAQQDLLEKILKLVAEKKYLVLAAGNNGFSKFEYPGNLFKQGEAMIVGAINAKKKFSSYSSGKEVSWITWMISDDAPLISTDVNAINRREFAGADLGTANLQGLATSQNTFSPWQILSLDVRGSYGSSDGVLDDPAKQFERDADVGLYTNFGGTSAASAIAVGLLSRAIQPLGGNDRAEFPF